jgi:DUF1680 family protein
MKRLSFIIGLSGFVALLSACNEKQDLPDYPIQPVNLTQVEMTDDFWLPRIRTIQQKTIQYAFDKCETEGRLENFITAGQVMRGGTGKVRGTMPFDDTDVYKTIEGASYSLVNAPDVQLEHYLDSVIHIVGQGQEPDGYLTTWRTIDPANPPAKWIKSGGGRWFGLNMSHELYNSGHLFEAASAHYRATGKRNFLDIALRNADLLVKVFGDTTNYEVPGHQIVETGLIKLYQITGKQDYLHLAKKFLDLRGDNTHRKIYGAYSQDHLPVAEQDEVVGHAVRAVYMYAGMTDIAAIYNDSAYRTAIHNLWDNMVEKKMYITGGLGARHDGEAFGDDYELPNLTAYSETCAAIGGVYWCDRMFRLTGDSKYFDVLERMLYNALIAGISLNGTEFFYPNPLEADGKYAFNHGACTRQAWFDCSCCPTNLIRFIPSMPNLIYAVQDNAVFVNLFTSNTANILVNGKTVQITQETNYPWNGKVKINVKDAPKQSFSMKIRIPGWVLNRAVPCTLYRYSDATTDSYSVSLNGKSIRSELKNGYLELSGKWTGSDVVELNFPMQVRRVIANENVKDNQGLESIEYGPLVYCAEETDNADFDNIKLSAGNHFTVEKADILNGINLIKNGTATFIPYYAWSNRGVGKMKVWLPF